MSADLAKRPTQEIDGFDYDDTTEGEDERLSSGLIIGEDQIHREANLGRPQRESTAFRT